MAKSSLATLEDVAKKLKKDNQKINLLYAFNATGKTRLSMEFKRLIYQQYNRPLDYDDMIHDWSPMHVLYFNAFTEDLFHWNNDLEHDESRKMNINVHSKFVKIIEEQGKDADISRKFQQLTRSKIDSNFDFENGEISFHLRTGNDMAEHGSNIKISRGEERMFVWSIFYVLLETVINELKETEPSQYLKEIKYVFIDDPISSLDDSYVIDVAVDLANLLSSSDFDEHDGGLKFVLTTHHPLFYNVLHNEIKSGRGVFVKKQILHKLENGFSLESQEDSPFGYHLVIKDEIERAIRESNINQYHFNLMRNLLEKTATFLGYKKWSGCIFDQEQRDGIIRRINLYSHSSHAEFTWKEPEPEEKKLLEGVFLNFIKDFKFNSKEDE